MNIGFELDLEANECDIVSQPYSIEIDRLSEVHKLGT